MKHIELAHFLIDSFGSEWYEILKDILHSDYFYQLGTILHEEQSKYTIYPSKKDRFRAFQETPFDKLKGIILGQDCYHDGSADGLCFSASLTDKRPPSLNNILKEMYEDIENPTLEEDLTGWAKQGILMLNTALTVREKSPNSHKELWSPFTKYLIQQISKHKDNIVWMMWGNQAQSYKYYIDNKTHSFVCTSHPSPLGAYHGERPFMGSRCFSQFNRELLVKNKQEIIW